MHDDSRTPCHPDDTPAFDLWLSESVRPGSRFSREERELIGDVFAARLIALLAEAGRPPFDAFRASIGIISALNKSDRGAVILRNRVIRREDDR